MHPLCAVSDAGHSADHDGGADCRWWEPGGERAGVTVHDGIAYTYIGHTPPGEDEFPDAADLGLDFNGIHRSVAPRWSRR